MKATRWRRRAGRLLFLAAAGLLGACGGDSSTSPAPVGRWVGAVGIDGPPLDPTMPSYAPVLSGNRSGQAIAVWGQVPLIWSNRFLPATGWDAAPLAVKGGGPGIANQPAVALSDSGVALVVWPEGDPGNVSHIWGSHGDTSTDGWSAPEIIDAGGSVDGFIPPEVAIDSSGNGMAAWWADSMLTFRYYRAGVGWAPPDRFPSKGLPALTFDATGRAVAAWGESPSAAVVYRYEPGQGWSLLAQFVPDGPGEYLPSVLAFDSLGRGVLGMRQDSGGRFGPSATAAALFDGNTWSGVSTLTDQTVKTDSPVAAISTQGGLVAWSQVKQPDGQTSDLATSTFTVGSGFGGPKVIATAQLIGSESLAMNPQGEAFAAWIQNAAPLTQDTNAVRIWASRYAAGAWDAPQQLQAGSATGQSPNVAADASGDALVTWVEGPGDNNGRIWANRFEIGAP
jgi:hypothetical protein